MWLIGGACVLAFFGAAPFGALPPALSLVLVTVGISALFVGRLTHYRRRLGSWTSAPIAPVPFAKRPPSQIDNQIVAEAAPFAIEHDEPDERGP